MRGAPGWPAARGRRRRSLWWSTVEGTLAAASDNLAVPYLGLFALAAGGGPREVALATAIPALVANVLQLPFGWLTAARPAGRRTLWLVGSIPARLLWLAVAALPWLVPRRDHLLVAYLTLLALRSLFVALATPAWTALMADLTHRAWRGSYFAVRNILGNLAALAGSVAAGYAASRGYPVGYAWLFAAAAASGLLSLLALVRVEELPPLPGSRAAREPAPAVWRRHSADDLRAWPGRWLLLGIERWQQEAPEFGRFALTSLVWNLAVHLPMALFPVYFSLRLRGSPALWGLANGAMFFTTVLGQRVWARRCDRTGARAVLLASGMGCVALPLLWAVVPGPEWVVAINLLGGYVWAGYNLAAFNYLLETTPDARRPAYVGIFNMGVGLAAALGPLLGTELAERVGMEPVMVLSATVRALALALFARPGRALGRAEPAPRSVVPWWRGGVQFGRVGRAGLGPWIRGSWRRAGPQVHPNPPGRGARGAAPPG